ncbi:MAG: hypothetical protein ORN56_07995, partial [Chitinophagales bacterium]|nr:hypothetical protein [Chitinophagales bacterium]
ANTTYYYFLFPYNWNYFNTLTVNYLTAATISNCSATTLAPPAPSFSSLSAASGYYGSTLSVYGTNMGNVTSITIGGVSMTNYTVVSSTQIDITINNASANGAVVLNHLGGSVTGSNYTVNGYITTAALTYTTASCWLGGAVPPAGAVVNIAHAITVPSIALASAPSTIRIMNGGAMTTTSASTGYQTAALTINAGGTLTLGPNAVWNINAGGLTNNGTINLGNTFGGTIKITGGSFVNNNTFNQGTGKIDFTGTCTLTTANTSLYNLDVNGALTLPTGVVVNNVLNMNSGASIVANGLTYGSNAYVSYNASMSPGLEWPINVSTGTSIPNAVTIAASSTLTLNGTGTHQLKGNLVLNGTLVLSGSNDIAVSGDISGTGTLTAGTRKLSFNGTTQNLNAALSFYNLDVLCANLYVGANTTVTNKLNITAADTLTNKLGFTFTTQSPSLNPSIVSGTFINQGAMSVSSGSLSIANGGTFIHNSISAIATNLGNMTLSNGSTWVYRGNSALIPAMSISGRTFYNLRFESTSGTWTDNSGFSGGSNCTINGDLFIGTGVTLLNSTYTGIWNIAGNMQVDGVMPSNQLSASLTGTTKTLTGSGTVRFKTLTVPGSYTLATSFSASTSTTVTGTLMAETYVVSGAAFTLSAGGTLGIGHNQGITSSGNQGSIQTTTRSFSTAANYTYNGTASQVAGSGLPATVANLTVQNT